MNTQEDTTTNEAQPQTEPPKTQPKEMEVIPASEQYLREANTKSLEWMNPKRWAIMQAMANTFISSGAVPASIGNAAQMIMVFQAGYEAGMQPVESLQAFYIVNGKITMYGDAVTAQIIKAGHIVEWGKCDDQSAELTITRGDNGKSMTGKFTIAQAEKRGLFKTAKGGDNVFWQKYPENMLKYKALGTIVDFIVPDALRGVSVKEIIEADMGDDGGMVADSGKTNHRPAAVLSTTVAPAATNRPSLQDALDKPAAQPVEPITTKKKTTKKAKGKK